MRIEDAIMGGRPTANVRGAEWQRDGVTREVFLVGRWALKIPKLTLGWQKFLCGLLSNMQERDWGRCGISGLCPILFSIPGGWLVVMRRAQPLTDEEWRLFDPKVFCLGNGFILPVEHKRDSFGTIDGATVAIDYGN